MRTYPLSRCLLQTFLFRCYWDNMILVSYVDILDFVGEHRQSLIDGEDFFNANGIKHVNVKCMGDNQSYHVTALCSSAAVQNFKEDASVTIKICRETREKLRPFCSCKSDIPGKCAHIIASLIYIHRHSLDDLLQNEKQTSEASEQAEGQRSSIVKNETEVSSVQRKQPTRKLRQTRQSETLVALENHKPEEIISSTGITSNGMNTHGKGDPVLTNLSTVAVEDYDDEIDIKEHGIGGGADDDDDDDYNVNEDDELFDENEWDSSSDGNWKPFIKAKKRSRKEAGTGKKSIEKLAPKRKKTVRKTRAMANTEAKELLSEVQLGEDGKFHCPSCSKSMASQEKFKDHIRDVHILKKPTCDKCNRSFQQPKALTLHQCIGKGTISDEEEVSHDGDIILPDQKERAPSPFPESEPAEPIAQRCLLCEVVADSRAVLHTHLHSVHDDAGVIVCTRCGQFRLPSDHICPSSIQFLCYMCKCSFKAGRDYWNHFIRHARRHVGNVHRARCGWPSCSERFTTEEDLMAHMRLHLPQNVALMCSVCKLILRNTDSKLVHMERHDVALYECGVCRATFEDKDGLKEHWDVHKEDRPHQCPKCGWRFPNPPALKAHIAKFHEGGPFSCAKCPQKFDDRTDVRIHFSAAHGKVRCPVCPFRCANQTSLERHTEMKHASETSCQHCDKGPFDPVKLKEHLVSEHGDTMHTCPTCATTFAQEHLLKAHIRTHADSCICQHCQKNFKSLRDLEEHKRMHTGEKPFVCQECGLTFKRPQNLEYHIKGAHKNERNFVCPECHKRFISNADMKRHLRYNHQGGKKWHLCPECGHKLPSMYNLKLHVLSKHTGERPHRCLICDQGFVASSDLKKHILYKHRKVHPYGCDKCDKRYQRKRDLQLHQQRHHGENLFVCRECGKNFESYASMMQHSRYHTTEEPFQCAKCGRRFPHKMNLSRHLCTPDIKKNYRCHTCGINFTTSGSLKSHRRRLHPGDTSQPPPPEKDVNAPEPQAPAQRAQLVEEPVEVQGEVPMDSQIAFEVEFSDEKSWRTTQPEAWGLIPMTRNDQPQTYQELVAAVTQEAPTMHIFHAPTHVGPGSHQHQVLRFSHTAQSPLDHIPQQLPDQPQDVQYNAQAQHPSQVQHPIQVQQHPSQVHHHPLVQHSNQAQHSPQPQHPSHVQHPPQVQHLPQPEPPPQPEHPPQSQQALQAAQRRRNAQTQHPPPSQQSVQTQHPTPAQHPAHHLKPAKSPPPLVVSMPQSSTSQLVTYVQTMSAPQQATKLLTVAPSTLSMATPAPAAAPATSCTAGSQLILGTPIQTTSDGAFHLVFVPNVPGNQK